MNTIITHKEVHIRGGGGVPQIAPNCIVDTSGDVHESVIVHPFTQIVGNVSIGEGTVIGSHVNILGDVQIGRNVRIQSNVFIPSGTIIGDDVFIGPGVTILNDKYPPSKGEAWRPVTIENGVAVGGAVTILPGVTLHEGCGIGAGSVVTKDIPRGYMAYSEYQKARIQSPRQFGPVENV